MKGFGHILGFLQFHTQINDIIISIISCLCYLICMMISFKTPSESLSEISSLLRERRLVVNLTQEQLAEQANVSLAVLRKFERTGKISLESFIKLVFVLGLSDELLKVLKINSEIPVSLDDIINETSKPKRKRASRSGRQVHD